MHRPTGYYSNSRFFCTVDLKAKRKTMKKIILLALLAIPFSTLIIAQPGNLSLDEMRTKEPPGLSTKPGLAQAKAELDFLKFNPHVSAVRWYDDPKGFFVYYMKDGKRGRSFYDRKGYFVYSALSYTEDLLTQKMKDWIWSSFDTKVKITHVNEIRQDGKTIHIITVTDDKAWKKLRIEGDDLEVIDTYKAG
jgi:hypothetical protein